MMKHELLLKASAAIHISHKLSLIQQQLWNALAASAFYQLGKEETHTITEQDLLDFFPYETRNTEHLKQCLEVIVGTTVKYNLLEKDKKTVWGVFTMLAQAELKDGVCTYAYAPKLREKLRNPDLYTRINLLIQQKFSSKYSLALYELCLDYLGATQTPWINVEQFRDYMGVETHEYKRYKDLNMRVINVALKEVNQESDIKITLETTREKRKIVALKFHVERKKDYQTKMPLFEKISKKSETPLNKILFKKICEQHIAEKDALDILQRYSETLIERSLEYMKTYTGEIKAPLQFLKKCLDEKWYISVVEIEHEQREKIAREDYYRMSSEERLNAVTSDSAFKLLMSNFDKSQHKEIKQKITNLLSTVETVEAAQAESLKVLNQML